MKIAFLIYDDLNALDAAGAYDVLSNIPGAQVVWVAAERGPKRTVGGLRLVGRRLSGRRSCRGHRGGAGGLWLAGRLAGPEGPRPGCARCTRRRPGPYRCAPAPCSSGEAGILRGKRATTYWLSMADLPGYGAEAVSARWVVDGKVVMSAGVSAGIDMALALTARIAGETVARPSSWEWNTIRSRPSTPDRRPALRPPWWRSSALRPKAGSRVDIGATAQR